MRLARLAIILAVVLSIAYPTQADGPGPYRVHLPIIGAGCDMTSTSFATLEISDGEVTIDLLRGNVHLSDWKPAIPQLKAGGIWQDSALATGRRMVDRRFGNVSDSLSLVISSPEQDDTIREIGDLLHLLEKARDFTASSWQSDPVWLKRQAGCETNPTYALIFDYKIPQLSNPYAAPFAAATQLATMHNFSLSMEHSIWLSCRPGVGECVQTSGVQAWNYAEKWETITTDPVDLVGALLQSTTGRIFAGEDGQIWYSDDDGVNWLVSTVLPAGQVYSLLQTTTGRILAGESGQILYTDNDGVNWFVATALPAGSVYSLLQTASGRILAGEPFQIWYSDDDGTNWALTTAAGINNISALLQTTTGRILAADWGQILKSDDNGATWSSITSISTIVTSLAQTTTGKLLLGGDGAIWQSWDDGENWAIATDLPSVSVYSLLQTSIGRILAGEDGTIWLSDNDGISWSLATDLPNSEVRSLLEITTGDVLASDFGRIWVYYLANLADMGMAATCTDSVFIANKQNVANLTGIYIDDGGVWSTNIFPFTFPGHTHLLPAAPAVGDAVYFGIDTSVVDSGPFESLVFDLYDIITYTSAYTILWEYYTGAAWATLATQDGTNPGTGVFRTLGVSSVHWSPPANWATRALNLDGGPAVTGYWVRARVSALVGTMTAPSQQNRDIYSIVLPYADIAAAQVGGDIPAIAQVKLHNRSDKDGRGGSVPNLWDNRVIVGMRSYDRGPTFSAYLNASDEQNPTGVTVTDGANTAIAANVTGITGRVAIYTGPGGSVWADEITFTLGPTIARDYYGTFHAFVRISPNVGSDPGDIHARLQVRTGSGGVTLTSAQDYTKGTGEFEVLDLGRISIPASGLLSFDDLGDSTVLAIQLMDVSTNAQQHIIHDLILIPVDECAVDATDYANITLSVIGQTASTPHLLDIDSLTYHKVDVRTIVRTADGNGFVTSVYVPGSGPMVLQANAHQRLWMFAMQTSAVGTTYVWVAPPWIAHSVQVLVNERWLGLREDR